MTEAMIIERLQCHADRVRDHSAHYVDRRIARELDISVEHCVREGREAILARLAEIDGEWDIDRILMAHLALAGGVAWCPPAVVWRRLGAHTKSEIELERSPKSSQIVS